MAPIFISLSLFLVFDLILGFELYVHVFGDWVVLCISQLLPDQMIINTSIFHLVSWSIFTICKFKIFF